MLEFSEYDLDNGLHVIHHLDETTPFVAINVLYDVGARDEKPSQTGFAHLFEHLMFGGSVHITDYDKELQKAGGVNNAYTTNDITNYYLRVPAVNAEVGTWLESDRMLSLAFSQKSLDVQKKVVVEEFKENYLNKPYGDAWQIMREMIYKVHPYQWRTIGKEISHIQDAKLSDVQDFFHKYYKPSNATLCVAGNISYDETQELVAKWFAPIESGPKPQRDIPQEPRQEEVREQKVYRDVPSDALYMAYPMSARLDPSYYTDDLISDLLGNGQSSRLYQRLVKGEELFSSLSSYQMGSLDEGVLVITGMIKHGIDPDLAKSKVDEVVKDFTSTLIEEGELEKVKNKVKSNLVFEEMDLIHRANAFAFYHLLGDTAMINTELSRYEAVTREQIKSRAEEVFRDDNSNTLYYLSRSLHPDSAQ